MKIRDYFDKYNIKISDKQEEQFYKYYNYLIDQNKVMNLTGIVEFEDVVIKHFIDSAMIYRLNIELENKTLVDVGTGAGFPGLVLAILEPNLEVTLIDSLNKRVMFLERTIELLGLKNVRCFHTRGEEFAKKNNTRFDLCVSRAVARIDKLFAYTIPLIKIGGKLIAYKGVFDKAEENDGKKVLNKYRCKYLQIDRFKLTDNDNNRCLVVLEKTDNSR